MVSNGYCQYEQNVWQTHNGITVRQGYHIEWFRAGYQDPNTGDQIYTWSDCREGDRDVYAQKMDVNGNPLWGDEGKLISRAVGRQEDSDVIYVGDGNWIFAWVDYRRTPNIFVAGDVYAQKVDSNGDPLWDPAGVAVCTADGVQISLRLVHDGSGGLIILWEDDRADVNDIYAHHVLSSGVVDSTWPADGLVVVHELDRQEKLTVDTDGQGGAIVAWEDKRSVASTGMDIYAQRVTPDGTLEWDQGGLPICTLELDQSSPKLCPDGRGGAYIVWSDRRSEIHSGDLYFQRVDDRGNPYFDPDSGAILCDEVREQFKCRIMYGGEASAIFTWEDYRNDPTNTVSDIYAQKVDSLGNFVWGSNSVVVCNAPYTQDGARLTTDGAGGAIIAWEDQRVLGAPFESDIYVQRILANGIAAWTTNGVEICNETGWQHSVLLKPDLNSGAFLVWADLRTGSIGLYIQHVNNSGQIQMTTNGVRVHYGIDGNVDNPMIVQATPTRFLTVWEDTRFAGTTLFVQVVDQDGNLYLQENGDSLYTIVEKEAIEESQLVTDFQQGGLLVWRDNRPSNNGFNQVFAQRLDSDGTPLWTFGGVHVFSILEEQQYPHIAGDESGGAFVAWSGIVPGLMYIRIYAQHLDASGNQMWNQRIQVSVSYDVMEDFCRGAVPDGEGGVIITWYGGVSGDYNVLAQKLDANGNALWQAGGLEVCNVINNQKQPVVIPDGTGGAVFAWEDKRDSVDINVVAQRVDRSGNLVWPDTGLIVCDTSNVQGGIQLEKDSDGNIFIIWEDYRDSVSLDLYMQKITPSGELLFPHNGLTVVEEVKDQVAPKMVSDSEDGVYIVWQDGRVAAIDSIRDDIYCSHIVGNGELADPTGWSWQANGNVVCDAVDFQYFPAIATDGEGGGIVVWSDLRASGKDPVFNLFMQRINDFTTSVEIEKSQPVPVKFSLEQNYPNPFNPATRIRYNLSHTGHVKLVIYDILGRKVRILQNQVMTSGSHEVIWNGKNSSGTYVSSGIYFYKLEVNDDSIIRKMVLLK